MENVEVPRKLKTELPRDPAIPLLGIHPEKMETQCRRDVYTPPVTAALPTVAKTWRQPQAHPPVNG